MIRKAVIDDIDGVLYVIKDAKDLLKSRGSSQWQDEDNYPNYQTFKSDVENGFLYIKEKDNRIIGVCALVTNKEPTYDQIYHGSWLNNEKYYAIHRLAIKKECYGQGIAKEIINHMELIATNDGIFNIRVDTGFDNNSMINLLLKCGYVRCGIIHLHKAFDPERLAYHKVLNL